MNLNGAKRRATELGLDIRYPRRTGEVLFIDSVRLNACGRTTAARMPRGKSSASCGGRPGVFWPTALRGMPEVSWMRRMVTYTPVHHSASLPRGQTESGLSLGAHPPDTGRAGEFGAIGFSLHL